MSRDVLVTEMHFKGFERCRYIEQTADSDWIFVLFWKVNGPDDVQYVFSFRDKKRTVFGYKALRGTAMWDRNVRKLANNIVAKKTLRRVLLSDDPELAKLWKQTRS